MKAKQKPAGVSRLGACQQCKVLSPPPALPNQRHWEWVSASGLCLTSPLGDADAPMIQFENNQWVKEKAEEV